MQSICYKKVDRAENVRYPTFILIIISNELAIFGHFHSVMTQVNGNARGVLNKLVRAIWYCSCSHSAASFSRLTDWLVPVPHLQHSQSASTG